jgi:hypothetical protein
MADIFISHSERDRDIADQLAAFLTGIGRTVWWDPNAPSGFDMSKVRATELAAAHAVIVLWTRHSRNSPFALHEAITARDANKLLSVKTDDVQPQQVPVRQRGEPLLDASDFAQIAVALSPYFRRP